MKRITITIMLILSMMLGAAGCQSADTADTNKLSDIDNLSGVIPEELELIPAEYEKPCDHPGTMEKLMYTTWESFTYDDHSQELTKEAWVYIPYGYDENEKYNIFYLSHGGWSNETTIMGTADSPAEFKHIIDNSIDDGKMVPMILVMVTYNNTSRSDSGDYSLALKLTDHFHNELVNDIIPAVESKYSTYASGISQKEIEASRDHRGFGGFSMGSVNTWCTFRYALPYFRYFMPMSGNYTSDGKYMASLVTGQGYTAETAWYLMSLQILSSEITEGCCSLLIHPITAVTGWIICPSHGILEVGDRQAYRLSSLKHGSVIPISI